MKSTKAMRTAQFYKRMSALGFDYQTTEQLRRIQMTLHRWSELECGDGNDYASWGIERDETTDKPYLVRHPHSGKSTRSPIADREKGALKRLDTIMAAHPDLVAYYQTDPRGCALYILRASELNGHKIDEVYSRGFGVCVD